LRFVFTHTGCREFGYSVIKAVQDVKNIWLETSVIYESDVFSAILKNKPVNEIESIVDFYDYIEINPVTTMNSMINDESVRNVEEIKNINKTIYQIATKMGKTVIASSNSHYLDKEEQLFRKIIIVLISLDCMICRS